MSPGNFKAHLQSSNSLLNVLFHNCAFCMVSVLFLSWLLAFFFLFFFYSRDNMYMAGKIFKKFSWPLAVVLEIDQCNH